MKADELCQAKSLGNPILYPELLLVFPRNKVLMCFQ